MWTKGILGSKTKHITKNDNNDRIQSMESMAVYGSCILISKSSQESLLDFSFYLIDIASAYDGLLLISLI